MTNPQPTPHSPLDQAPQSHFPARDPGSQQRVPHTPDSIPPAYRTSPKYQTDLPNTTDAPGGGIATPTHYQIGQALGQALCQALIAQRDQMIYQQLRAQGIIA